MWHYQGQQITSIDQLPEGAFGFIYRITNLSKQLRYENPVFYIGRKNLYSERKAKLTQKEIAEIGNKRRKFKQVVKESDWLTYTGSCKELNEDIANGDDIIKEILYVCPSKRSINYQEVKHLFILEVLERDEFYNGNISSNWYRGNLE